MITYDRQAFAINLLLRVHGSAIYRSIIPALSSVGFFILIRLRYDLPNVPSDLLSAPEAVGLIVSGITFMVIFRASKAYDRYWEACANVFAMQSKWMDATNQIASYHMQNEHYDPMKPPSYFDYPDLDRKYLTRDRERVRSSSSSTVQQHKSNTTKNCNTNQKQQPQTATNNKRIMMSPKRSVRKSINIVEESAWSLSSLNDSSRRHESVAELMQHGNYKHSVYTAEVNKSEGDSSLDFSESVKAGGPTSENEDVLLSSSERGGRPRFLAGSCRLDGNWSQRFGDGTATFCDPKTMRIPKDERGFASDVGGRTPALFLQELAHLASLLTAVALSTLRNDVDGVESPLDFYRPGQPWPECDPANIPNLHEGWSTVLYFFGMGRSPEERTRYNSYRPLPVIGGVSDAEITFLQMARGPYAKTTLCCGWLIEFMIREHLAGSLGKVDSPIISRIMQFLSDGMKTYNDARKIMFIPFPFPHAQLSAFFLFLLIPLIPFVMDVYTGKLWLGGAMSFFSVLVLSAIQEASRELENPFRNIPNELPVVTLMAQFNEALITMFSGYHPDLFWNEAMATTTLNSNDSHSCSSSIPTKSSSSNKKGGSFMDSRVSGLNGLDSSSIFRERRSTVPIENSIPEGSRSRRNGGAHDNDQSVRKTSFTANISPGENNEQELLSQVSQSSILNILRGGEVPTERRQPFSMVNNTQSHSEPVRVQVLGDEQPYQQHEASCTTSNPQMADMEDDPLNSLSPSSHRWKVERLRAIIEEQGRIMEIISQEQARLNKMVVAACTKNMS